ncbi:hypothetical protein QJQ45_019587, partial [Haematococcus lacustris]
NGAQEEAIAAEAEAEAQADAGVDEAEEQLHQLQAGLQHREQQLANNQRLQQLQQQLQDLQRTELQRKEQQLADWAAQQQAALVHWERQLTEQQQQLQQQQADLNKREQDLTGLLHELAMVDKKISSVQEAGQLQYRQFKKLQYRQLQYRQLQYRQLQYRQFKKLDIEHASNGAVVAEYMKALVATDKLSSYVSTSSNAQGLATGEDHRSLAQLLKELQQQATAEQADDTPGSSLRRPLHVVVQGGQLGSAHKGMGLLQAVWFLLLAVLLLVGLGFCWLVGRQVVRGMQEARVQAASSTGVAAVAAASTPSPAASSVEPKEYKKEEVSEKEQRTFADVRGCDEAKEELREVVEFLKNPAKFTRLGAKLPKGVLLTGPPGTGKTLLARAVAGEAGVPFFYRAGSEFEELYVGVGSRRMRALFQAAKKKAPCIVFIDEIDAIGGNRKHWENHSRKTLNQLLVEMDGFESSEGVIVMAATNLAETLDAALKRPGRFDRQVAVPLPDIQGRIDILDYYLGSKPVAGEVDRDLIARQTQGFSGADLSNLVNEAALLAAKQGADLITPLMLDSSFDKIRMGVERKNVRRTAEGIKRTAYHEAGHALVAMHTPGASPVHKATIVPRGHALGMVTQPMSLSEQVGREDEFSINKQQMLARIWVCMGGQVAEEVIFGVDQVTSGATDDLRQATEWARYMVTECGLNDAVGPMYVAESSSKQSTMSESLKQQVDEQVRLMLVEARDGVRALLRSRLPELHCLAQALQERETLTAEQIREVMAGEQLPGAGADGGAGADKPELPGHLEGVLVNVGATQGGHLGKAAA